MGGFHKTVVPFNAQYVHNIYITLDSSLENNKSNNENPFKGI